MTQNAVLRLSISLSAAALFVPPVVSAADAGPRSRAISEERVRSATGHRDRLRQRRRAGNHRRPAWRPRQQDVARRGGPRAHRRSVGDAEQDPAVSHLSGDVPVRRTMAVTAQAIGADQVWDSRGITGSWSRWRRHWRRGDRLRRRDASALRNRLVASFDFTAPSGLR